MYVVKTREAKKLKCTNNFRNSWQILNTLFMHSGVNEWNVDVSRISFLEGPNNSG